MSGTRLLIVGTAVHLLIELAILTPPYVALALRDDIDRPGGTSVGLLGGLMLVTWWATRRAIENLGSSPRSLLVEGARTGGLAGVRFSWGVLSLLLLLSLNEAPSSVSDPNEQPGFGGPLALLLGLIVMLPLGSAIGYIVGAALGGFIALIDRTLLAIAHTTLGEISPR